MRYSNSILTHSHIQRGQSKLSSKPTSFDKITISQQTFSDISHNTNKGLLLNFCLPIRSKPHHPFYDPDWLHFSSEYFIAVTRVLENCRSPRLNGNIRIFHYMYICIWQSIQFTFKLNNNSNYPYIKVTPTFNAVGTVRPARSCAPEPFTLQIKIIFFQEFLYANIL